MWCQLSGLSLLGGLHWPSITQCLAIIRDCLWTSKGFSIGADLTASPSSAEASKSRSKHDWMHRVGSQRRLELAIVCSDPPTDTQCKCNAHALSCTNFAAIVGVGQFIVMVTRSGHGLLLILSCTFWIQKWKSYSSVTTHTQITLNALPVTTQCRQRRTPIADASWHRQQCSWPQFDEATRQPVACKTVNINEQWYSL